jgi:membrane-bound ClpP family serine protease
VRLFRDSYAMTKISILQVLRCVAAAVLLCAPASAEILKVVLNDTIQPITAEYLARAIDEAKIPKLPRTIDSFLLRLSVI